MKSHWLAGSGDHGCLYDFFACCLSLEDAVGVLAGVFELGRVRRERLAEEMYLDLDDGGLSPIEEAQGVCFGAEYCEIAECDLDDLADHLDPNELAEWRRDHPEYFPEEEKE